MLLAILVALESIALVGIIWALVINRRMFSSDKW